MIKIEAIVRPERVSSVTEALEQAGCGGFYYQNVTGQGQQGGVKIFTGRGGIYLYAPHPLHLIPHGTPSRSGSPPPRITLPLWAV